MGQRYLSAKGDKPFWSGVSRLSVNDRGQRRFTTLDNCYVSQDGSEIRAFPGYATILDLTAVNNSSGYERYVPDAVRPVLQYSSPDEPFRFPQDYSTGTSQSLYARAKPSAFFGFEQIGGEIFVLGESRFREQPIYDSSRTKLTISQVSGQRAATYIFTLSGTPSGNSALDTGAGLNGIRVGHIIYIDELTLSDGTESDQTQLNNEVVGKQLEVTGVSGSDVTVSLVPSADLSANPVNGEGEIHRIRPNRNDSYPTGTADGPYASDYDDRPDDPDALTCWRVTADLDLTDTTNSGGAYPCYPSWVANRQRDFGDGNSVEDAEGIVLHQSGGVDIRGASRREQRKLPYRPNIEPALDRIILACPQYGCMFQVPAKVPIDAANWTGAGTSTTGIVYRNNDIYDRPRALGIPKPRLIESTATPNAVSPDNYGTSGQYTASVRTNEGSPDLGLVAGEYRVAVAYEDAGTGDEGLASETISVTVSTSADYARTLRINYIHPGYHFPEALPLKMNVYLSEAGGDAMAFYGQFELAQDPIISASGSEQYDISGFYGVAPVTPTGQRAIFRSLDIPLPSDDSGDISDHLDPTRLAPQSASMPRGASACKFVRGVLFSGGAMGNAGPDGQLWSARASSTFVEGNSFFVSDEMDIQAHSIQDAQVPSSNPQDGDSENVTLGIAGRAFPDAYQGIPVITDGQFPGNDAVKNVDRVLNRKVNSLYDLESSANHYWHLERLRLRREAFDRGRRAGATPTTATSSVSDQPVFYMMPRGQVQVGDPGAPNRSSRAFIKVVDPLRGDDITAFGHLGGSAVFCTRKETYSYSWYRNPGGEEPSLMSNEFGCIASNSMVEFDGGLAWLSARGPVAIGAGLQHVGADVAEDFYAQSKRYARDSRGMMRHAWGAHDAARGLVYWGLLRTDADHTISDEGDTVSVSTASDERLSRFPCDEILIWSYRANAFSHWRPPAGLEVYWMRPIADANGHVRMCFLAADQRIYALDDEWSDANAVFNAGLGGTSSLECVTTANGTSSTTLAVSGYPTGTYTDGDAHTLRRNLSMLLKAGMIVEFFDSEGNMTADTTIASVTTTAEDGTGTVELSAAQTWTEGQKVRIGVRQRMKMVATYMGAETMDTNTYDKVHMRYASKGAGFANARVKAFSSERGHVDGEESLEATFTKDGCWEPLGYAKAGTSLPSGLEEVGRRVSFAKGRISGPEVALQVEITGETQIRIQDLIFEAG